MNNNSIAQQNPENSKEHTAKQFSVASYALVTTTKIYMYTRHVLSMIHLVRPTVLTSCDHYFQITFVSRYFEKCGWTYGCIEGNMCENNNHYRPGL